MNIDYYNILNIKRSSSIREIKKSFHKLAMQKHPDKGGNPAEFIQIKDAYEVLTDPIKKEQYDSYHNSVSFVEYGGMDQQKANATTKQKRYIAKWDKKRNCWTIDGGKIIYDKKSGTYKFGDLLG